MAIEPLAESAATITPSPEPNGKAMRVTGTQKGYCNVCHQPQTVMLLAVTGWDYLIALCEICTKGLWQQGLDAQVARKKEGK